MPFQKKVRKITSVGKEVTETMRVTLLEISNSAFTVKKQKKYYSSVQFSPSVVSDSFRPHGLQPTRLLHPWDFPAKSTGVGCHCLLHTYMLSVYK